MDPIQKALADLRATPTTPTPTTVATSCCDGSRRGYKRHTRRGEEACPESKAAAAAYMRDYYDRTGRWAGRQARHRTTA